jgi:probable rRNA maturation factor
LIDIETEDAAWTTALPDAEAKVRAAIEATLALLSRREDDGGGVAVGDGGGETPEARGVLNAPSVSSADTSPVLFGTGEERSVSLLLTNDLAVQALNARFRDQDKPTNVLSFPAPTNPERFLGDVALAYETCAKEAAEQGKPLAHHLQHLVAHGVLHLLGYDHRTDAEAQEMEGLERAILAGLGIPDPYAAGEGDDGRA